jgi:hypothetical protein
MIAPTTAGAKQGQLIIVGRRAIEFRYGHAEQPDALGGRQQRAHQFNTCPTEEIVPRKQL